MCSIIGQTSKENIVSNIFNGLKKMEYRGYDSAGIAVSDCNKISVRKEIGKVQEVDQKVNLRLYDGHSGIGHTRWATHGGVNKANAHPHMCNDESFAVVHNGIIENYMELKKNLVKEGWFFLSETDTEIIPNLLSFYFKQTNNIENAIVKTVSKLKGNYSFVAMTKDGTIIGVKHYEPLIFGIEENQKGFVVASDILGFENTVTKIIDMDNNQFVIAKPEEFKIYDFYGKETSYSISKIPNTIKNVTKGKFDHFTIKEITEQRDTILVAGENYQDAIDKFTKTIGTKKILLTGSGTSYYAGLIARYLFPMFTSNSINIIKSSEMKFSEHFLKPGSNLIAISQSGESADVLESVKIAKRNNMSITSVVNAMTSSLSKESDIAIGLNCGTEIGVAATKSFTSQLAIFYKIADALSGGKIKPDFVEISKAIEHFLKKNTIKQIARELKNVEDIYILGRGIHHPIAMEGALKIKELTYVHAEGVSTGELKHGPLALMDESTYVIIISPEDETYQDNLSSIHEIKARGAKVIGISNINNELYDYFIEIPKVTEIMYPLIEVIPFQLLSYYLALEKGLDPDYPRNLAKCVTVK